MTWERKPLKFWLGKRQYIYIYKKKNREQLKRIGEKEKNWSVKPLRIRKIRISIGQEESSSDRRDS